MQRQNASKLQEFKTSGLRERLRDGCGWTERERERGIGNRGQSVLGLLCLVCLGRSVGCASCTNYLIYQEYCKDHNRTDRVDNCGNVGEGGGGREGGGRGRGGACEMHLQLQLLLHKRNSAALKPIKVRKVGQLHWRRNNPELPR